MAYYNYNVLKHNDVSLHYLGYKPTGYVYKPFVVELDTSIGSYPDSSLPNAGEGYYDFSEYFKGRAVANITGKLYTPNRYTYRFGASPYKVSGDEQSAANSNVQTRTWDDNVTFYYPVVVWFDEYAYTDTQGPGTDESRIYMSDDYDSFNVGNIDDYDDRSHSIDVYSVLNGSESYKYKYLHVAVPCLQSSEISTVMSTMSIRVHCEDNASNNYTVLPTMWATTTSSEYLRSFFVPGSTKGTNTHPLTALGSNSVSYCVHSYNLDEAIEKYGLRDDEGGIDNIILNYQFPSNSRPWTAIIPEHIAPLPALSDPWMFNEFDVGAPIYFRKESPNKWNETEQAFKVETTDTSVPVTLHYMTDLMDWYPTMKIEVGIDSSLIDSFTLETTGRTSKNVTKYGQTYKIYPIKGSAVDSYGYNSLSKTYYVNFTNFTEGKHHLWASATANVNTDYTDYGNYRVAMNFPTPHHWTEYNFGNYKFNYIKDLNVQKVQVNNDFGFTDPYGDLDAVTTAKTFNISARGGIVTTTMYSSRNGQPCADILLDQLLYGGAQYTNLSKDVLDEYMESKTYGSITVTNRYDITRLTVFPFQPSSGFYCAAAVQEDLSGDITDRAQHFPVICYIPSNTSSTDRLFQFRVKRSDTPSFYINVKQSGQSTSTFNLRVRNATSSSFTGWEFTLEIPNVKSAKKYSSTSLYSGGVSNIDSFQAPSDLTAADIRLSDVSYRTSASASSGSFAKSKVLVSSNTIEIQLGVS